MKPAELRDRLEALFGPVATTAKAAKALRVSDRAVQRWCAKERRIPEWLPGDLDRIETLVEIAKGANTRDPHALTYQIMARAALPDCLQ